MYEDLVDALQNIAGVQFAEYEWKTRPTGNYGTVQLDFEAEDDNGDDLHQDRAWEGSVDLFTHGKEMLIVAAVESALEEICEGSWYLNSEQYERETGLIHREFVFQIETR
jgi:hypothetical protein